MRGKSSALIFLLLSVPSSFFAQGLVYFGNASSIGWSDPGFDRLVRWDFFASQYNSKLIPGDLVTSNYAGVDLSGLRTALYYAPSTEFDPLKFVQASGGPQTFRISTSLNAGSWFGGVRTLDNIAPGVTANLFVAVWDIKNGGSDPFSAGSLLGMWTMSEIFQYTPPTNAQPQTTDLLMTNLVGFSNWRPVAIEGVDPGETVRNLTVFAGEDAILYGPPLFGGRLIMSTWYHYGTNIPGATGANVLLVISNAQPADAGPYSVMYTNLISHQTFGPGTLTVIPASLSISQFAPNHTRISWRTNFNRYTVESASSLTSSWAPVTDSVVVQTNEFLVMDILNDGPNGPLFVQRFFRLRAP